MTIDEMRDDVAHSIATTLDWRCQKAVEFPHDSRNTAASHMLAELQRQIEDDAFDFDLMAAISKASLEAGHTYSEAVSEVLRRVGFSDNTKTADDLLRAILKETGADAPTSTPAF